VATKSPIYRIIEVGFICLLMTFFNPIHFPCSLVVNINCSLLAPTILLLLFLRDLLSELNRLSVEQQICCDHRQIHDKASQNLKGYPKKATLNMIEPELKEDAVEGSKDVGDHDDE